MNVMIAPAGTPLESAEKFKQIGDAFLTIAPALSSAFDELSKAAARTATAFQASFTLTMSRRDRRRMQTAFARMDRRPSLIHKGGKP
jgi:hypothetical protein